MTIINYGVVISTIQFYITIILLEYKNSLYSVTHTSYITIIFCVCWVHCAAVLPLPTTMGSAVLSLPTTMGAAVLLTTTMGAAVLLTTMEPAVLPLQTIVSAVPLPTVGPAMAVRVVMAVAEDRPHLALLQPPPPPLIILHRPFPTSVKKIYMTILFLIAFICKARYNINN